jgi:hypothetical protein
MKRYRIVLMLTLALIALTYLNISEAYAIKPGIPSSYDVTTNYHGIDVPPETEVTATATTTDTTVTGVTFIWKDPDNNEQSRAERTVDENPDPYINGYTDSFTPGIVGDWGVQAIFHGHDGTPVPGLDVIEKVAIRATSFFHVPEFQIVGTAGSLLSMLAGLVYYMRRKGK